MEQTRMIDRGKRSVLGVGINVIDYDGAARRVLEAARESRPFSVSALAVHGVMTGALDRSHRYRLNRLDLVTPDGQPVRWALNFLHGTGLEQRVYGPTLMLKLCQEATRQEIPIFLYGSQPQVMEKLKAKLTAKFRGIRIVGTATSRFRTAHDDEENARIIDEIKATGARLVFVGLGCPRQEVFAYENAEALSCPVVAIGAAFDFHAGTLSQAPAWMQDRGLEWLYRFLHEPRRLWRRYMLLNPLFCWNVARQWISPSSFASEEDVAPTGRRNYI